MNPLLHILSLQGRVLILLTTILFMVASSQGRGQVTGSNLDRHFGGSVTLIDHGRDDSPQIEDNAFGRSSSHTRAFVLGDLLDDLTYLLGQPDFYAVVGGIGMSPSALESAFDDESPEFTEMWGASQFADKFFELGEGMGSASYTVAASALCYSVGKIGHSSGAEAIGSHLLRAQAINGLITVGLKGAVNRTRPDGSAYSYPSGHTSTAFTIAGVLYHDLGPVLGVPAFAAASYVGFSRLQENKHYLSDIIAGAVIGTYVAYKVTHRQDSGATLVLTPNIDSRIPGASVTIRF